jgi:hypothetical protein
MVATSNDQFQHATATSTASQATWTLSPIDSANAQIELVIGRWSVGAGADNRISLNGESIAPLHCLLIATEYQLILRAWNQPTLVNGESVREAILQADDELTVGENQFRVGYSPACEAKDHYQETPGFAVSELPLQQQFSPPIGAIGEQIDQSTSGNDSVERCQDMLSQVDVIGQTLNLLEEELSGRRSDTDELDNLIDRLETGLTQRRELSTATQDVMRQLRDQVDSLQETVHAQEQVQSASDSDLTSDPRVRAEQVRLDSVLQTVGVNPSTVDPSRSNLESLELDLQDRIQAKLAQLDDMTRLMQSRATVIEQLSIELEHSSQELKEDRIALHHERLAIAADRTLFDEQRTDFNTEETQITNSDESADPASDDFADSSITDTLPAVESTQNTSADEESIKKTPVAFPATPFGPGEDWAASDFELLEQRPSFGLPVEQARSLAESLERQCDVESTGDETDVLVTDSPDLESESETSTSDQSEWTVEASANDENAQATNDITNSEDSESAETPIEGDSDFEDVFANSPNFAGEFDVVTGNATTQAADVDDSWTEETTDGDDDTTAVEQDEFTSEDEFAIEDEFATETDFDSHLAKNSVSAENAAAAPQDEIAIDDDESAAIDAEPTHTESQTSDLLDPIAIMRDEEWATEPVSQESALDESNLDESADAELSQAAEQRTRLRHYMESFGDQAEEAEDEQEQVAVGISQAAEFEADGEISNGLRSRDEAVRQLDELVREATSRANNGSSTDLDSPATTPIETQTGHTEVAEATTENVIEFTQSERSDSHEESGLSLSIEDLFNTPSPEEELVQESNDEAKSLEEDATENSIDSSSDTPAAIAEFDDFPTLSDFASGSAGEDEESIQADQTSVEFDDEEAQGLRSRLAQMFDLPESETSAEFNAEAESTVQQDGAFESLSNYSELETVLDSSTEASVSDDSTREETSNSESDANSEWDAADPDSVSSYMQQLLARNRRQTSAEETEPKPEAVVRPSKDTSSNADDKTDDVADSVAQVEPPVDDKRWLTDAPMHQQDRQAVRADMQALRKVANVSARSAVATASRKQLKVQIVSKTAASLMALGFGVIGLLLNVGTVIASCVIALGFFFAADLALTLKKQVAYEKRGKSEDTQEETAPAISVAVAKLAVSFGYVRFRMSCQLSLLLRRANTECRWSGLKFSSKDSEPRVLGELPG